MGRSRGGVKVPNVKLRPALPNNTSKLRRKVVESDDEEPVESLALQVDRAVFRGVMVCASGVKDKRDIFELVRRMGGSHTTDFTDLTTHLIASEPGSEKYRCALERGTPVVTTSWVYEAHERWLAGELFSVHDMVDAHRLPPFNGVKICITGNEVADVRNRIHKQTRLHGGEYLKSLDKTCTHLLCSSEKTSKVEWANRVNAEREVARAQAEREDEPPINILWEEWFWDCLFIKGHLDYDRYYITNPRPKPMSESVMVSPSLSRSSLSPEPGPSTLPKIVPLSGLLSAAQDSVAPARRMKHAATREWEAIMKPRGYGSQSQQLSKSMDIGDVGPSSDSPMKKNWVFNSFDGQTAPPGFSRRSPVKKTAKKNMGDLSLGSEAISAVRLLPEDDLPVSRPATTLASNTFLGKFSKVTAFSHGASDAGTVRPVKDKPKSVFSGLSFRAIGDAACDNVFTAITHASGTILTDGLPDYYIVRLVGGSQAMQEYPLNERSKFRTECWLERCLFEGRLCPVEDNITYAPFIVKLPVAGTSHFLVALSGLDSSQKTWVTRLLRLLDIKVSQYFSVQCSHLLCPTRTGIKCKKADEWSIPIVDLEWLIKIAKDAIVTTEHSRASKSDTRAKMEASMKEMKLGITSRPPINENEPVYSPIFNISSPSRRTEDPRPASPTSPSPQRKRRLPGAEEFATNQESVTALPDISQLNSQFPSTTSDFTGITPTDMAEGGTSIATATPRRSGDESIVLPIPSSATPSPFKGPGDVSTSDKPVGSKISAKTASALQRNIGAILGSKRVAEEDNDTDATNSATNGAEGPRKRPRRPRAKNSSGTPKKLDLSSTALHLDKDQYNE
ncbi:hypothetical protein FRC19_008862, partial [Serendipita sp. 401]